MYLFLFAEVGIKSPLLFHCSDALRPSLYSPVELVYDLGHWESRKANRAKKVNGWTDKQHMEGRDSGIACLVSESQGRWQKTAETKETYGV